jgi:hypothetical protein
MIGTAYDWLAGLRPDSHPVLVLAQRDTGHLLTLSLNNTAFPRNYSRFLNKKFRLGNTIVSKKWQRDMFSN